MPRSARTTSELRPTVPTPTWPRVPTPENLVRTSLNNSQMMYWEPTKRVAKLRALNAGAPSALFKINLDGGHAGASGRYDYLREIAFDYALVSR